MKKIFTLLFALSLTLLGTAQPPKGSTIIKVDGVSFNQVLNAMLEAGYFIEMKDAELQIARTSPQSLFNGTFLYVAQVRVKDSSLYLSGQIKIGSDLKDNAYSPIQYKGLRRSPQKVAFEQMEMVAKELRGPVSYQ